MSGIELIQRVSEIDPTMEVIVITAADSLETAIQVIRQGGVYDYLQKPLELAGRAAPGDRARRRPPQAGIGAGCSGE